MSDQSVTSSVTKLKELLFEPEAQRIEALQQRLEREATAARERDHSQDARLDALFERAGTIERLQTSVATVLDGAFREAELSKHKELSQAVAPLVVSTIKYELKNSQDEMVDALYPLTGRLVKQYVQSAMNDLMVEINAKLGGGRRRAVLAKSNATGLTPEEIALAEANKLEVEELFLVRRSTGDLVAHWQREGIATNNRDVLTASYMTAIMSFAEDAFGTAPGALRTLTLEDTERLFVRGSTAYLLAVRTKGSAAADVETAIDEGFIDALDQFQKVQSSKSSSEQTDRDLSAILPGIARTLDARIADEQALTFADAAAAVPQQPSFTRLYVMLSAVLLPLIAWVGWTSYQSYLTNRTASAVARVIDTSPELRGYRPQVQVDQGGQTASIVGIVPSEAVRTALFDRVRAEVPGVTARDQTAVLPSSAATTAAAIEELRQSIARLEARLIGRMDEAGAIARTAQETAKRADTAVAALPPELKTLREMITRLDRPPTPRDTLEAATRSSSVFFANGTDFRDPEAARNALDKMASILKSAPALGIRIVGYTDERGTAVRNSGLALTRADAVMQELQRRGVSNRQMLTLGRPSRDIARDDGPDSNNRRVEFEAAFDGELGGR